MPLKVCLNVLLIALTVSLPANAAYAPVGFFSQTTLAARASVIAGKPATVYCTLSDSSWRAEETARGKADSTEVAGHADAVGGSTIYLSPNVCRSLLAKLGGRPVDLLAFGIAAQTLAHEAEHLSGHADEGDTDCSALAALPKWLRSSWRIRNPQTLGAVMRGARSAHQSAAWADPAYRGNC